MVKPHNYNGFVFVDTLQWYPMHAHAQFQAWIWSISELTKTKTKLYPTLARPALHCDGRLKYTDLTLAYIFDHAVCCVSASSSGRSLHLIINQLKNEVLFVELSEPRVKNCWWGWQNRTDPGKCTHQCDETQGNNSTQALLTTTKNSSGVRR